MRYKCIKYLKVKHYLSQQIYEYEVGKYYGILPHHFKIYVGMYFEDIYELRKAKIQKLLNEETEI